MTESAAGAADSLAEEDLNATRVWVVDGGPNAPRRLPTGEPTCVIAVDRGLVHALRLGLRPNAVVGDLDSVSAAVLARSRQQWPDLVIRRHRPDKDRSDLDLALSFAWGLDPCAIAVLSSGGGRLDHLLSGMVLLARPRYAALPLCAYVGDSVLRAATVGMGLSLDITDGNLLTLVAVGGTACLATSGLRWNLEPSTPLRSTATLGLSNELAASTAGVGVVSGSVLAIQTHGKPLARGASPS